MERKPGTQLQDEYTLIIISRLILLRMRNDSDKNCTENQNTFSITHPPPEIRAL